MAKIYELLLSTNILRGKRRHSFDPQRVTLLGEDNICIVNLLETPRVIVFLFFFYYMIDFLRLFQKRTFVLSTLLQKDSICMVNLLETPRVIVFFFIT